jgi:putative transposase
MRKSRFSDEQMVRILRECDSKPVADVAKKHGVSEGTLYIWREKFGTMEVADAKRLKGLEAENARLKKLVAERDLEIDVVKEIAAKNGEHGGAQTAGRLRRATRSLVPSRVVASERAFRDRVDDRPLLSDVAPARVGSQVASEVSSGATAAGELGLQDEALGPLDARKTRRRHSLRRRSTRHLASPAWRSPAPPAGSGASALHAAVSGTAPAGRGCRTNCAATGPGSKADGDRSAASDLPARSAVPGSWARMARPCAPPRSSLRCVRARGTAAPARFALERASGASL